MPVVNTPGYLRPPFYLTNGHLETIVPSVFFKITDDLYQRERLELPDGDFLDIDWIKGGNDRCVVISHGLEGDANRHYVKRTARHFSTLGWDVAAWNCRSCSGEMNRLPRFYHHGASEDLESVIKEVLVRGYQTVVLIGYSMGGSMSLKYLGETRRDSRIRGGVFFSVPCNLRDSALQLQLRGNRFYEQRFVSKLLDKIRIKAATHPAISLEGIENVRDFDDFHDRYTAPLHGFSGRADFFEKSTCDQFFPYIEVPVLIVNALNDPMLGEACYPYAMASEIDRLFLEVPARGGHVGFTLAGRQVSYMELRAEQFIDEQVLPL